MAQLCHDLDYEVARQLQAEYDKQNASDNLQIYQSDKAIVDPSLEISDPTPDVQLLFQDFDARFFWNKLVAVEVRWSPRMTLCAGICHYEGRGGLCSVRLSKPLLQLRPRKDLIETLLHEMIHAYLFVTANNKDHDAHGPEFLKHQNRINARAGTRISVYHNFHDEVNHQRKHWWQCDGPCRKRPPYFGLVKRSMNRAPSKNDFWWAEHQLTCGGKYSKIKEPETFSAKSKKEKASPIVASSSNSQDIRKSFGFSNKTRSEPKISTPIASKPTVKQDCIVLSDSDDDILDNGYNNSKSDQSTSSQKFSPVMTPPSFQPADQPEMVSCPVCTVQVPLNSVNNHMDMCLS